MRLNYLDMIQLHWLTFCTFASGPFKRTGLAQKMSAGKLRPEMFKVQFFGCKFAWSAETQRKEFTEIPEQPYKNRSAARDD